MVLCFVLKYIDFITYSVYICLIWHTAHFSFVVAWNFCSQIHLLPLLINIRITDHLSPGSIIWVWSLGSFSFGYDTFRCIFICIMSKGLPKSLITHILIITKKWWFKIQIQLAYVIFMLTMKIHTPFPNGTHLFEIICQQ